MALTSTSSLTRASPTLPGPSRYVTQLSTLTKDSDSSLFLQPGSAGPTPQLLLAHILLHGKPVVLHNGWIDLLFLYHTFYAPLPRSLPSFMADLTEMFRGGVYDTKAIAQYKVKEKATFLEYVFRKR